ncbi:MAG: glycerophosphodiester phosphodiesterase [Anaerolineales bacterium]|nr:glycerophosphodiester phosphodiesterase [Anaerolineales bacterium]
MTAAASPRTSSACLRVGHGGAAGHARSNSLRSLRLALEMGVDMVEFDVRPCQDGLVLLHDDSLAEFGLAQLASQSSLQALRSLENVPDGPIATLQEALHLLKGRAQINVDVKDAGYEAAVVEAVTAQGLLGDVLFSSTIPATLQRIRQLAPQAQTGLSYPEDRGNASGKPYLKPAVELVLAGMRLALPYRAAGMLAAARANAVMLYHKVVTEAAVRAVHRAGGRVFTWTVDDRARMRALRRMGVDGITTNHPEIFDEHTAPLF